MARHANRDTVFGNVDFLPLSFQYFCLCKIVSTSAGSAKTPFVALFPFRRAIRRLAPQGGKALRFARARIPAHCRARAILSSFLMARHANRDTAVPCNTCSAAASRHKEACPARGQSSSRCAAALRSSTNPYALPRVRFFFISLWRATQIGIRCYRIPICVARHKELESLTFGSVDQRSIQLS